jgi:hypothetical protein
MRGRSTTRIAPGGARLLPRPGQDAPQAPVVPTRPSPNSDNVERIAAEAKEPFARPDAPAQPPSPEIAGLGDYLRVSASLDEALALDTGSAQLDLSEREGGR